jgi:lipopolysaccharide biosynthesis regulator YciM
MTTLGRLYRQRGEHDRAIHLHQELLKNRHWSEYQRAELAFELAEDFYRAGLVDRAERTLQNHCVGSHIDDAAKRQLWMIYQRDRNWLKAIQYAHELMQQGEDFNLEIAQFHCELAQQALFKKHTQEAHKHIDQALKHHKRSVRASILLGDLYLQEKQYQKAIEAWMNIEQQNSEYLSMVAERLMDAYQGLGNTSSGVQLLSRYYLQYPNNDDFLPIIFQHLCLQYDKDHALDWLREHIYHHPKLIHLETLWKANQHHIPAELTMDYEFTQNTLQKYAQRLSTHRCKQCNFKSRAFFWNCPACHGWESFSAHKVDF